MVEKRQTSSEASSAGGSRQSVGADEMREEDAALERLPGNLPRLRGVVDTAPSELLDLAEKQVNEARRRLGSQTSKPRLKGVETLFRKQAGPAPQGSEDLPQLMRNPELLAQVAAFDSTYDHTLAMAYNLFDKASIQSGAALQTAYDDWSLAVRLYKSEMRAGGTMFQAAIEEANHPQTYGDFGQPQRGDHLVQYYTRTDQIGTALLAYQKRLQHAGADLADAYGALITALYASVNALAVAEATLISVEQAANKTFWTSVQNAAGQIRN